jgi:DNA-binding MarR family transcriptional regulator
MQDQPTVSVWLDLFITVAKLEQIYGQALEPLEITVIEWYILRALYAQDGQRPSDLANAVGRAPTSFTPMLDKLEAKDLIERNANLHDRRSIHIHVTEAGKKLSQPGQKFIDKVEKKLRAVIPDDMMTEFASMLLALQRREHK